MTNDITSFILTYITLNVITTGLSDIENVKIKKLNFWFTLICPLTSKKDILNLNLNPTYCAGEGGGLLLLYGQEIGAYGERPSSIYSWSIKPLSVLHSG